MNKMMIVALLLCCLVGPARVAVAEPAPEAAPSRTILLVDDHDVLYRSGTERVLTPLQRHPAACQPGAEFDADHEPLTTHSRHQGTRANRRLEFGEPARPE